MDGFVIHMVQDEFIYIYIYIFFFSTNSYAFSLRISDMYMARNYNYPTAVFFLLCIGFYKMLIKLLIIVLLLLLLLLKQHFMYRFQSVPFYKYTDDIHCTSRHSTCICVQHQV